MLLLGDLLNLKNKEKERMYADIKNSQFSTFPVTENLFLFKERETSW